MTRLRVIAAGFALLMCARAGEADAQGAGSTGAQVLQFNAGSRAAALSGAYAASHRDAEALFYNPAGAAALRWSGALSYETYVEQISLATAAGVVPVGKFAFGLGMVLLDGGDIAEITPDPDYGGVTGRPTGRTVSAGESAVRLSAATSLLENRLRIGMNAGLVSANIDTDRLSAPVFDFGAQYDISAVTVGLALRNIGAALSGDGSADLPSELRVGATAGLIRSGAFALDLHGDVLHRLAEESTGFVLGIEGGLVPAGTRLQLLGRVGFSGSEGDGGLAPVKFGGGIVAGHLAVDYAYQNLDLFGGVHRFGLRWSRTR